ncbi:MAG: WD40 repeat domain-containing protein, partial [Planctomycetaceae bacterium]|nr:WD40 repeat domain-containing protein [Planctomycetaceae bacterium]
SRSGVLRRWQLQLGKGAQVYSQATGTTQDVPIIQERVQGGLTAFSYDGTLAVIETGDQLVFWNLSANTRQTAVDKRGAALTQLTLTNDGSRVSVLQRSENRGTESVVWDTTTGEELMRLSLDIAPQAQAFTAAGTRLAIQFVTGILNEFDVATGTLATAMPLQGECLSMVSLTDSTTLIQGRSDGSLLIQRSPLQWLARVGPVPVHRVAFDFRGEQIAVGTQGGEVRLFESSSGKLRRVCSPVPGEITSVAFSTDSQQVFAGSTANCAAGWDLNPAPSSAVSPDRDPVLRRRGLSATRDATATESAEAASETVAGQVGNGAGEDTEGRTASAGESVTAPATAPNESSDPATDTADLGSGVDNSTKVPLPITALLVHSRPVFTVCPGPHPRQLLTGAGDGTIRVWSLNLQDEIATLEGHQAEVVDLRYTAEGQLCSLSRDLNARTWTDPIPVTKP